MYATVRHYANAKALSDAMSANKADVQHLLSSIPGFISYAATIDGDSVTTITICEDKEACDESTRRAREWVKETVKGQIGSMQENGGETFMNFSK
jgi:hypothetical protein